jgi:hypothetical protein
MEYIGIDLHCKRSQVAARDGNGEMLFNRGWRLARTSCSKPVGDAGVDPVEVVFEATFGWGRHTAKPRRPSARCSPAEDLAEKRARDRPAAAEGPARDLLRVQCQPVQVPAGRQRLDTQAS